MTAGKEHSAGIAQPLADVPRPVVDPALTGAARDVVAAAAGRSGALAGWSQAPVPVDAPYTPARIPYPPHYLKAMSYGIGGIAAWLLYRWLVPAGTGALGDLLDACGSAVLGVGCVGMIVEVFRGLFSATALPQPLSPAEMRARRQALVDAHRSYVLPGDLTQEAAALLVRAQDAAARILSSDVHREDLVDRAANEVFVPHEVWAAAASLAEYSRLRAAHEAPDSPGSAALDASFAGIAQRVDALAKYADRIERADAAYRAQREALEQAEHHEAVMALHARTAADDLAAEHLADMAAQTDDLAEALRDAVAHARTARVEQQL